MDLGHYKPSESGTLGGGGSRRWKPRSAKIQHRLVRNFGNVHLSDRMALREIVPDFDPELEFEYSPYELILLAEKILDADPKPWTEHPYVQTPARFKSISKREIFVASGTPDPSYVSGSYWRTHPSGRATHSEGDRKASGYRLPYYKR